MHLPTMTPCLHLHLSKASIEYSAVHPHPTSHQRCIHIRPRQALFRFLPLPPPVSQHPLSILLTASCAAPPRAVLCWPAMTCERNVMAEQHRAPHLMGSFMPALPMIGTLGGTMPAFKKPGCPVRCAPLSQCHCRRTVILRIMRPASGMMSELPASSPICGTM